MDAKPRPPMNWDRALLALDGAIQVLDLAERGSNILPAKAVFVPVVILLATIRVRLLFFGGDLLQVHT